MEEGIGLIWMSAGNSYFKEEIVLRLLEFAGKNFNQVIILSPDEPAEHTYKALGYEEKIAKRKAKLNSNLLKNRANRAIENLKNHKSKFKIIEYTEEIIPNKIYKKELIEITNLYFHNKQFQKDAKEITKKIIENKSAKQLEISIDEAVNYLLKELAFVLASPKIYKTNKVTYIYHNKWEIFEKLIEGKYDNLPRSNLSFILSEIN